MFTVWKQTRYFLLNQSLEKVPTPYQLGVLFLSFISGICMTSRLSASAISNENANKFNQLEETIWLADTNQLDHLEAKTVRLLQIDPSMHRNYQEYPEWHLFVYPASASQR